MQISLKNLAVLFCAVLGFNIVSPAQVLINEFMASNTNGAVDPDYDQSADWIEMYNAGTKTISLSGYFLTDNISDKTKWKFPSNAEIKANSFLLVWADGVNVGLHSNFKLSASGEELGLYSPDGVLLDSLLFGAQEPNISMGRKTDGATNWAFFNEATPGETNNTVSYDGIVKSSPDFSVNGGIFHNNITVTLKSLYGGDIRYTLDGSEPNAQSAVASQPINITKTTVVRARLYKPGQVLGPVVTNTYFIDSNNELSDLPIVSIASDPKNLYAPQVGIYVVHSTKPDWEIPINIELFEKEGRDKAAFNLPAGAKSTGLYSWQLPEKMLGISFRKEYGASKLEYPLIFEKDRKVYDTFSLRASGSDWESTLFRDGMLQSSAVENTNIDNSGFRPCVVYINGEFMGIHNIREKIDEDYIVGNYGLEPGTFDMIEEVDGGINVETGDEVGNDRFLDLVAKDLTIQANYDAVAAEMDIEDFTDVVCTEVYSGNTSIGHNLMKWKPKDSGKWKWILMDFDRCFFSNKTISFYVNETGWPLKELMKNQDYKKYFGLKLADLLFTNFNPARMIPRINAHQQAIEADLPSHVERWKGTKGTGNYSNIDAISSVDFWLSEVENVRTFAQLRPNIVLNDLTNYGFQSPLPVSITTTPASAGILTFNGLKIPVDVCTGGYPQGEEIKLTAEANAGFKFLGWKTNSVSLLIQREQDWKYFDLGTDLGSSWKNTTYDDSSWKTGQAELGYGDNDENTKIGYGGNSQNKYITSYFRKSFVLTNKDAVSGLTLLLKCDDGAVVFLNGNEIHRYNLPTGDISYTTLAIDAIGDSDESVFNSYVIGSEYLVTGNNVLAVEIHQSSATSSDISFDLELSAQTTGDGQFLTTNREYVTTVQSPLNISAVFESDGKCIIPTEITEEYTLNKACSPYVCSSDVHINSTGKLNIEKGVEIWMSDGASIYSSGPIVAKGTDTEPITFKGNPERTDKKWGLISISDVSDTSFFKNVIIEDATQGKLPREVGAITTYRSAIHMDNVYFDNIYSNPIATSYSDVTLTNSQLHSNVIGDLINISRGKGTIENCEFIGNNLPDNDAIDFNGGNDGLIKNCIIRDFFGSNSDAIDLGEKAKNIRIDGIYVHDITDKGVSVGQQSSVSISNSLFTNCNLGAGVKDSSSTNIDHCTYYGVGIPISTYEKIVGRAGGNVKVTNSILSNSYDASYFCDEYSTIDISYCSSDNEKLPEGKHNIFVNPLFNNPTFFDFSLQTGSSCIGTANQGNMGSGLSDTGIEPEIMISDIAYYTETGKEDLEFIGLYNPGDSRVDLSGYKFIKGITFTFPAGASIGPKEKSFVTNNDTSSFWNNKSVDIWKWESGRLADEGEDIQLTNEVTTMIDEVAYNNKKPWPIPTTSNNAISLSRFDVDNHFGEYWVLKTLAQSVDASEITSNIGMVKVYPNPSAGKITIARKLNIATVLDLFDWSGRKVMEQAINGNRETIDLNDFNNGFYIIKVDGTSQKLILKK